MRDSEGVPRRWGGEQGEAGGEPKTGLRALENTNPPSLALFKIYIYIFFFLSQKVALCERGRSEE